MSAALDAAVTAGIYVAWAAVILGLVIAGAAWTFRRDHPSAPYRPIGGTRASPASREPGDWEWPLRPPPFDPAAHVPRRRWDPEAYRGSLAEAAVAKVYAEREEE